MDVALVTGASSGIGLRIAEKLVEMEYRVYGLARDFTKTALEHERFIRVVCDVTDTGALSSAVEVLLAEEGRLHVLVNNAGVGHFGPHETIPTAKIEQMVRTNLLAPLALTQMTLRSLKETSGYIINIASMSALQSSRFGCAYAATKAGLSQFGVSLFDEVRKSGVRVVTIFPDLTRTPFYDDAPFCPHDDPACYITPECVADAVAQVLNQRAGTVITQMVIRPQRIQIDKKANK